MTYVGVPHMRGLGEACALQMVEIKRVGERSGYAEER